MTRSLVPIPDDVVETSDDDDDISDQSPAVMSRVSHQPRPFAVRLNLIIVGTLPAGAVAKYCDEYVCLCVCLSARISPDSGTTCATFTKFLLHVAYVRGSLLLRHVDDRPHHLSAGRG